MDVKIIDIPVPILSFEEETMTVTTGQVPLSLRQHIITLVKEKNGSIEFPYSLKSIVEIDNVDYLAEYYLIRNSSPIFTVPYEETDHPITKTLKLENLSKSLRPTYQLNIKLIKSF